MALYGLQHVLSMYAGVVAVPLIVGSALKLSGPEITYLVSAGLFISGLATLLQTLGIWKIGARQPIVQGTSFAAASRPSWRSGPRKAARPAWRPFSAHSCWPDCSAS